MTTPCFPGCACLRCKALASDPANVVKPESPKEPPPHNPFREVPTDRRRIGGWS